MRSKIFHILVTTTLLSISIPGHSDPVPGSFAAGYGEERPRPKKDLEVERAYTDRRWIGLRDKGLAQCPEVNGWKAETLEDRVLDKVAESLGARASNSGYSSPLSLARPEPAVDRKLLKKLALDRYCIYTSLTTPAAAFDPKDGLAAAGKDRLALSTTSAGGDPTDDLSQRIWPVQAQHFRSQTGQVTSGGSPVFGTTGTPRVRLTFIDSQPDGEWPPLRPGTQGLPDGSTHGFTLANLAHDLACPAPGSCAAEIATRRALGYKELHPQEQLPPGEPMANESGHIGLVSDLATAIYAEVLYWRQFEPDKKLILNLSLGWDGEAFGDLNKHSVSALDLSVQSVYNALRFARHSGALVIASAGNKRGGSDTKWPLLPAAWELRRPNWFRWSFCHKPVYAVSGAEWQGLPIANYREGAWTRRVAYADHAVTSAEADGEPTAMFTGTSVSAAVTSSIAAVVWHLRPELRPAQVMRLLARSGDVLDTQADFYEWKPLAALAKAPHTRRLSLCAAVAKACGPDGKRCPAPECTPWGVDAPALQKPLEDFDGSWHSELQPATPTEELVDMASQRWVIPQPEATPCPGCSIVRTDPPPPLWEGSSPTAVLYKLSVQIGDAWVKEAYKDDLDILDGKLKILCGTDSYSKQLPASTFFTVSGSAPTPLPAGPADIMPFDIGRSLSGCSLKIVYDVTQAGGSPFSVNNNVTFTP